MTYITDIRGELFSQEEYDTRMVVQIQYATDNDYFHVVVDRTDDVLDIHVCDSDEIYNISCKRHEEYTECMDNDIDFEPEDNLDNAIADARECYWENITSWFGDYKESSYSRAIDYAIYKLDKLSKGEEISKSEASELENVEFEIPDYPKFELNLKRGRKKNT